MTESEIQQALQALSQLGAAAGNSKAGVQSVGQSMARLRMEMQRGTSTIQANSVTLQRLMSDFSGLDEVARRSTAGQAMLAEQTKMASQIMGQAAGQLSAGLLKGGVIEAFSYFKNQVTTAVDSYQQGVSGTQAALKQQTVSIQSNIDILNRLSTGAALAAEMMAMIPNPASRLGAVLLGTTSALAGTASEAEKLHKDALDKLGTEISATTLSYQTLTRQGMALGDGMRDLRGHAQDMQLNLGELTSVVSKNKESLVSFGGSVTGGLVRLRNYSVALGQITKDGQNLREQLYRLGYTYEDQIQGIIDYTAQQQKAGQLEGKSKADIARASAEYMVNLRAISAYTGEDAKAAQARARDASSQLLVNKKLRDSQDPAALEKFESAVSIMPASMKKAMQQMVGLDGTLVDKNLNLLFEASPTRRKIIEDTIADMTDTSIATADVQRRYQERVKQNADLLVQESDAVADSIGANDLVNGNLAEFSAMLVENRDLGFKGKAQQNEFAETIGDTVIQLQNLRQRGTDPLLESIVKLDTKYREQLLPAYTQGMGKAMENLVTRTDSEGRNKLEQENINAMRSTLVALQGLNYLNEIPGVFTTLQTTIQNDTEQRTAMGDVSVSFRTSTDTFRTASDDFSVAVNKFSETPGARVSSANQGTSSGYFAQSKGVEVPTQLSNTVDVALRNPGNYLDNTLAKTQTDLGKGADQLKEIFNNPNSMTASIADLRQQLATDNQTSMGLMKQYTEKMDTLIAAMEDNLRVNERMLNEMA